MNPNISGDLGLSNRYSAETNRWVPLRWFWCFVLVAVSFRPVSVVSFPVYVVPGFSFSGPVLVHVFEVYRCPFKASVYVFLFLVQSKIKCINGRRNMHDFMFYYSFTIDMIIHTAY